MSDETNAVPDNDEDDALLTELRALAAQHDPVPPAALAAARSALAWRTMDAELAELMADSSVDANLAVVRGVGAPTMLTFESAGLTVEVEVAEVGGRRRVLGQLVPPQRAEIDVRHKGGTVTVTADELGRFSAGEVSPGPVSLRCRAASHVVETDWFIA